MNLLKGYLLSFYQTVFFKTKFFHFKIVKQKIVKKPITCLSKIFTENELFTTTYATFNVAYITFCEKCFGRTNDFSYFNS